MRLRQIEVFHAVYVNGSISAAARALNISQPSVSKVLRHAESQLGFTLFELVKGRLVPTDEAHALFREVDDVVQRVGWLRQAASNLKRGGGGHLRLGVVPSLGLEIIPAAIAAFRQTHPDVTFSVQTLHHGDILRALYERESDVIVAYNPLSHPRIEQRRLASCRLLLLAPDGTFDADAGSVAFEALEGHDFIDVADSGPLGTIMLNAFETRGVTTNEVASAGTYYIAAALVGQGCGLAVVDEFTAQAMASAKTHRLELDPPLNAFVDAVWLIDRPLSVLADQFLNTLARTLAASSAHHTP